MNSKIKTYLSILLLFLIVALLWSIAGNALFDLPELKKEKFSDENIFGLTHIFYVNDLNKSIDFYTEVLGFKLISSKMDSSGVYLAKLNLGSIKLHIKTNTNDSLNASIQLGKNQKSLTKLLFQVNDINVIYEKLINERIVINKIYESTEGYLTFDIEDPDGYAISFYENK